MPNPIFGGGATGDVAGVNGIPPYGQREKFIFGGAWFFPDTWTILFTTTSGNFTLGMGNFNNQTPTVCFTYRNRVYLGMGPQFNFSDNGNPNEWEEQGPGAGFFNFINQYGGQDSVMAFGQLQGRLAVFGRYSIQLWNTDADPNNFALAQPGLDNTGTIAPESVQQLGDYDCLYLDVNGVKSLRAKEVTLNAYVDDGVGSSIEDFIVGVTQSGYDWSTACGIVDPATKNYWLFLKDTIYVLSRSLGAKIQAWSTYLPTDNNGQSFTPSKFVVFNNQVFCRGKEGGLYAYGGFNASQYDNTVCTVVLPFLDDKRPDTMKQTTGVQAVIEGQWTISVSCDPRQLINPQNYKQVIQGGAPLVPDSTQDSTYDTGVYPYTDRGTHFSFMCTSSQPAASATLSALTLHYNLAEDVG